MASFTMSFSAKVVSAPKVHARRSSVRVQAAQKKATAVPTFAEKPIKVVQGALVGLALVNAPMLAVPEMAEALTPKMEAIRAKDAKFYAEKDADVEKETSFFASVKAQEKADKEKFIQVRSERDAAAKAAADKRKAAKVILSSDEKKAQLNAKAETAKSSLSAFNSSIETRAKAAKTADAEKRAERAQIFKAELQADAAKVSSRREAIEAAEKERLAAQGAFRAKNVEQLKAGLSEKKTADYKRDLTEIAQAKADKAERAAARKALNDEIIAAGRAKVNGGM